jgi:hypothetical protein
LSAKSFDQAGLYFGKIALVETADRADPVIWKIFKCCSRGNFSFRITFGRIVDVTANALILVHSLPPSFRVSSTGIFYTGRIITKKVIIARRK